MMSLQWRSLIKNLGDFMENKIVDDKGVMLELICSALIKKILE